MKICTKCGSLKNLSDFNDRPKRKDGKCSWCKVCNSVTASQWQKKNSDRKKARKYGLDLSEYQELKAKHKGLCAICGNLETNLFRGVVRELSIDHCHKTNKVRGLVCNNCNLGLGFFKDNVDVMASAISYLHKDRI